MKYNKKLVKEICDLLASGKHSIEDTCKIVGIAKQTYYFWKDKKPEFADAVENAEVKRLEAYKEMAVSGLAKLLDAHEYEEVTTEYENDKAGKPKIKGQKRVLKKIMPNPTAVIFTLTNRDNANWKNRQNTDITSKGEKIGFTDFLMQSSATDDDKDREENEV